MLTLAGYSISKHSLPSSNWSTDTPDTHHKHLIESKWQRHTHTHTHTHATALSKTEAQSGRLNGWDLIWWSGRASGESWGEVVVCPSGCHGEQNSERDLVINSLPRTPTRGHAGYRRSTKSAGRESAYIQMHLWKTHTQVKRGIHLRPRPHPNSSQATEHQR